MALSNRKIASNKIDMPKNGFEKCIEETHSQHKCMAVGTCVCFTLQKENGWEKWKAKERDRDIENTVMSCYLHVVFHLPPTVVQFEIQQYISSELIIFWLIQAVENLHSKEFSHFNVIVGVWVQVP